MAADQQMKRRLKAATFDEPQIESCSHLLVFCADADAVAARESLGRELERAGVDDEHRTIMMFIAGEMTALPREAYLGWAQNQVFLIACHAVLTATDLGLESCPMTHFEPEKYAQILGLPEESWCRRSSCRSGTASTPRCRSGAIRSTRS